MLPEISIEMNECLWQKSICAEELDPCVFSNQTNFELVILSNLNKLNMSIKKSGQEVI
jgi:hypothetical protein